MGERVRAPDLPGESTTGQSAWELVRPRLVAEPGPVRWITASPPTFIEEYFMASRAPSAQGEGTNGTA